MGDSVAADGEGTVVLRFGSRLGFSTDRRTGVPWVTSEQIDAPGLARWQEGTFLLLTDGFLCKYERAGVGGA